MEIKETISKTMKTKTIKQINDQKQRLLSGFFGCGILSPAQLARFRKISNIANRYSVNALAYLKGKLSAAELDEYWKITPVPTSILTSPKLFASGNRAVIEGDC